MAQRKHDVDALIARAKESLPKIEAEYNASLQAKAIQAALRIDIKNYLENLRSALDYIARDIVERHCPNASPKDRLYFPITGDLAAFDKRLKQSYPELEKNCPALATYLRASQPFQSPATAWISKFNQLTNENKHENLVEQTRTETRTVNVSSPHGSVQWGSGVTFGNGVSVMGVPIDPRTQLPVPNNLVRTEITTWVDFRFAGINESAITLLRESLRGVTAIRDEVYQHLSL